MQSIWLAPAILAAALLTASCGSTVTGPSPTGGRPALTSTDALVAALRQQGATVNVGNVAPQALPCSSVAGRLVSVNSGSVTVFEYPNVAAAEADATRISPDGSGVTGNGCAALITWVGPPHFYKTGQLIVLYVGTAEDVLRPLETVLGKPFASR